MCDVVEHWWRWPTTARQVNALRSAQRFFVLGLSAEMIIWLQKLPKDTAPQLTLVASRTSKLGDPHLCGRHLVYLEKALDVNMLPSQGAARMVQESLVVLRHLAGLPR